MMKNLGIGIVLAAVAIFFWGFLYWGMNPLPSSSWKQTKDDVAAGKALLEHFPESGTYYLPGRYNDEETWMKLHAAGPVAFIHLTAREGRPLHDWGIMIRGFLLYLVVVTLIALLLQKVSPALPSYADRVKFAALVGLAAAVMIDFGDVVWWYIPWEWKIHQAVYTVTTWTIAGLVLAKFVKPR